LQSSPAFSVYPEKPSVHEVGSVHEVDPAALGESGPPRRADEGDTTTSIETLIDAAEKIETVVPNGDGLEEVVGDKGYHSNQALVDLEAVGVRSYVSEPDRGRRNWTKNPKARDAVYRNRRRIRGARGKRLLRQRGERLERPFAHLYETGRMRRGHLRGHDNILKRVLLQPVAAASSFARASSARLASRIRVNRLSDVAIPLAARRVRRGWRVPDDAITVTGFKRSPGPLPFPSTLAECRDSLIVVGSNSTALCYAAQFPSPGNTSSRPR
jgi:hypothetical protein